MTSNYFYANAYANNPHLSHLSLIRFQVFESIFSFLNFATCMKRYYFCNIGLFLALQLGLSNRFQIIPPWHISTIWYVFPSGLFKEKYSPQEAQEDIYCVAATAKKLLFVSHCCFYRKGTALLSINSDMPVKTWMSNFIFPLLFLFCFIWVPS